MKSEIRELFGRFFVQFWGLAQEGPLPGNFTQFRSLCLYAHSTQSDCMKSCSKKEHFCWNMNDHVMNCEGWEAAGIAWKFK